MSKLDTAKKIISTVGNATDKAVEKDSNNLLLIFLIVIVWIYLFFSKGDGN